MRRVKQVESLERVLDSWSGFSRELGAAGRSSRALQLEQTAPGASGLCEPERIQLCLLQPEVQANRFALECRGIRAGFPGIPVIERITGKLRGSVVSILV